MIERDRRVSRFDDAKSIPRTSLSGLNDVGRRASLCTTDQFCRQSRRQPINVTTARRLTLAACNLYVYACACLWYAFTCTFVHSLRIRIISIDARAVETIRYFTMVLGSSCCHLARSPSLSGYVLWLSSLWAHHLDHRDISPNIKSMSHIEELLRDANQARTREFFRILNCFV